MQRLTCVLNGRNLLTWRFPARRIVFQRAIRLQGVDSAIDLCSRHSSSLAALMLGLLPSPLPHPGIGCTAFPESKNSNAASQFFEVASVHVVIEMGQTGREDEIFLTAVKISISRPTTLRY